VLVDVTSQTNVGEVDLDSFSPVTLKRVLTDDVRRIAVWVVGRVECARSMLSTVDVPTTVFRRHCCQIQPSSPI